LALTLTPFRRERGELLEIAGRVRRMFDLDADPLQIAATLAADPLLGPSVRARPGLRIPGAWDPFEACVRAILGQQVSVRAATTFAGRLVEAFGAPSPAPADGITHLFPTPERLGSAALEKIGLTRARAESIRCVARSAQVLRQRPESLEGLVDRLRTLPGVGPWTAHYLAMRAFGEVDAFPSGDLVLRKAAREPLPAALEQRSTAWRPWRAYAAMHLWSSSSVPLEPHMIELSRVDSPLGTVTFAVGPRGLCALTLGDRMPMSLPSPARETRPPPEITAVLAAYFAGDLRAIDKMDVDPEGTPFQHRVWAALRTIPPGLPGRTRSWRAPSVNLPQRAPWAPRTAGTRSRWSCPATG